MDDGASTIHQSTVGYVCKKSQMALRLYNPCSGSKAGGLRVFTNPTDLTHGQLVDPISHEV